MTFPLETGPEGVRALPAPRYRARMVAAQQGPPHDGPGRAHAALLAVQLCFGLFPVFGRWAFAEGGFAPAAVAGWRIAVGAAALGALAALRLGRRALPPRAELGRVALCSFFGVVANQGLFLVGLERSGAVDAGLVMCLIPVFTFVLAAAVGQERLRLVRAVGVGVALLGVAPLFLERGAALLDHRLGNTLMGLNAFSYSIYLVLSRPLARRHPPLAVIAWVYAGALPALPLFAWDTSWLPAAPGSTQAWGALAYVLVFPTVLGYLLNTYALARLRASTAAFYVYLQPVVSGIAGHFLLGEPWTRGTLRATLALFVGVALVTRRRPDDERAP